MVHNDIAVQLVVNKLLDWSHKPSTPIWMAGTLFEAAQIIKQLKQDRDRAQELAMELEKAKKERDAAVADYTLCKGDICNVCKYYIKPGDVDCEGDCETCRRKCKCHDCDIHYNGFAWRGVKEEA